MCWIYEIFQCSPAIVGWRCLYNLKCCLLLPCWCYETGGALGLELEDKMPPLQVAPSNMENKNTRGYLDEIRAELLHNISKLQLASNVQFQERPPDTNFPEVCFSHTVVYCYVFPTSHCEILSNSNS